MKPPGKLGLVYTTSLSSPISRPYFPKQTKEKRDRFAFMAHIQITETTQFQLEAKGKALLVLQGLSSCSVPSTQNPTVIQSSSLEETKQKGELQQTQLWPWSVSPFNFFSTICRRARCTDAGTEAALQGISPGKSKGPVCSGEIQAFTVRCSALLVQKLAVGRGKSK